MKSKLAQKITSLFITMSIILAVGANILAVSETPMTDFNVGDTIAAGTVLINTLWDYSSIHPAGQSIVNLERNDTWTADRDYQVWKVEDGRPEGDYYYNLYIQPAPEPEPQPSGTPITNFKADDTIAAGTTICNAPGYAMNSHIYIEGVSEPGYIPSGGTWTADQDYLVTRVDTYDGGWYDLYVKPASEPEPQPSGTPADQLNVGDTVAVGTVICDMDSHDTDAVLVLVLDTEYYVKLAMGDWTADQTYTVTDKYTDNGMLFVVLTPSSDPGPQPQPTENVPMSSFTVGDTIPAGTVLYNDCTNASGIKVRGQDMPTWVFPGQTWTADQNYYVYRAEIDPDGMYADLYVEPAGDPGPGPVDPSPVILSPEEIREMSMTNFVENLYLNALGRTYENIGRSHWMELLHKNATGTEIVWGFFNSQEFLSMNLSNEDYVRTLYRVFNNNSTPDASNVASMAASLENGTTREQLFNQFAATEEWASICAYYAVNV